MIIVRDYSSQTWSWFPGMKMAGHCQDCNSIMAIFRSSTGRAPLECQKSPRNMIPAFLIDHRGLMNHCLSTKNIPFRLNHPSLRFDDDTELKPSVEACRQRTREQRRLTLQQQQHAQFEELGDTHRMCVDSSGDPKTPPMNPVRPIHQQPRRIQYPQMET